MSHIIRHHHHQRHPAFRIQITRKVSEDLESLPEYLNRWWLAYRCCAPDHEEAWSEIPNQLQSGIRWENTRPIVLCVCVCVYPLTNELWLHAQIRQGSIFRSSSILNAHSTPNRTTTNWEKENERRESSNSQRRPKKVLEKEINISIT